MRELSIGRRNGAVRNNDEIGVRKTKIGLEHEEKLCENHVSARASQSRMATSDISCSFLGVMQKGSDMQ